jgi:hypothetical protein
MWRNCGEIKRKLRYNERKRKGSGCEAGRKSAIARVREYRGR